ncbi:uncharacterized protein LOC119464907 [Dermacentor silvarum]|uniref:uncharacterized protein LOC119464907 n=1 Tax=Dermacentor silvarum TaxID=543639 RepID=UPI002100A7B9|nr:uncharacterized protein LOC119464907 [Dermacentor silvarum]
MAHIETSLQRRCYTSTIAALGLVALFSLGFAKPTLRRYPLNSCLTSASARIQNVVVQSKMDRGQALLSFDVIVTGRLVDPKVRVTARGEELSPLTPDYHLCELLKPGPKGAPSKPCDFKPNVYHAEIQVSGYQAFYLTTEGGKSDVRFEVIDNGAVVGCNSSEP